MNQELKEQIMTALAGGEITYAELVDAVNPRYHQHLLAATATMKRTGELERQVRRSPEGVMTLYVGPAGAAPGGE